VTAYQLNLSGGKEEAKPKRCRNNEEAQHQALLFVQRTEMQEIYPNLRFLFSTLNGLFMPPHIRARAIEAGMAKGILDLFYMVRRVEEDGRVYSGLVMDLKRLKGGRPTPEQLQWAKHLQEQGWLVLFPAGVMQAWWSLCAYEGISGADNWAEELQIKEEAIRRTAEQ
jgi:hypothetical protein